MTKDKALEELFLEQKPHFDDKADFIAALTRRLDAVECIRQHQETTIRRYRIAMIVTFVVGIISGAITMTFVLSMPADVPFFTFQVESDLLLWFAKKSRIISATILALLISFGLISLISNIRDTLYMRRSLYSSRSYK